MSAEVDNQEELDLVGQNVINEEGEDQSAPKGDSLLDGQDEGDEVEISIGGVEPPAEEVQKAPEWVRELRKTNRELQREKKELEAKLNAREAENKPTHAQKKPTLEDFDFDSEKYEEALDGWYDAKRHIDAEAEKAKAAQKAQDDAWQERLSEYGKMKAEIKVRDFDEAEADAMELLSEVQRGIILDGADNPAMVIYALGKNHAEAKKLASMQSLSKFTFAVAKLEKDLKVTPKKTQAPPPERTVMGSARVSGSVDSTLDRLRAEAEKSGDYTKVTQYKAQKRKT